MSKISQLRNPFTNVQVIQNIVLLRLQSAYHFLFKWHSDAARQVQQEYINTLKWFYTTQFQKYWDGLCKLEEHLLGSSDYVFQGSSSGQDITRKFTLSTRGCPTVDQDADVIVLHLAVKHSMVVTLRLKIEIPTRCFIQKLQCNANGQCQL